MTIPTRSRSARIRNGRSGLMGESGARQRRLPHCRRRRVTAHVLRYFAILTLEPCRSTLAISQNVLRARECVGCLSANAERYGVQIGVRGGDCVSECLGAFAADVALSIFTGLLSPEHGVRDNAGYRSMWGRSRRWRGCCGRNGYRTGAAVSAYVLRGATGAGFDEYDDAIVIVDGARVGRCNGRATSAWGIAERWMRGTARSRLLFSASV
jgi:hypothetical protein